MTIAGLGLEGIKLYLFIYFCGRQLAGNSWCRAMAHVLGVGREGDDEKEREGARASTRVGRWGLREISWNPVTSGFRDRISQEGIAFSRHSMI